MDKKSLMALAALVVVFMLTTGFWGIKSKGTSTHFERITAEGTVVAIGSNLADMAIYKGTDPCTIQVWSRGLANYDGSDVTTGVDTVYFNAGFKWEKNASLDSVNALGLGSSEICIEVAN